MATAYVNDYQTEVKVLNNVCQVRKPSKTSIQRRSSEHAATVGPCLPNHGIDPPPSPSSSTSQALCVINNIPHHPLDRDALAVVTVALFQQRPGTLWCAASGLLWDRLQMLEFLLAFC